MRSMLFERAILLLAGTALSGLSAATDSRSDTDPMLNYGTVPKTVVSDKFRFFILAGLEGSGHHYVMSAGEAILKAYPDLPRVDKRKHLNTDPWYLPIAMGESPSHYAEADLWGKEEMQRLAEQAAGFPSPTVYFPKIAMSYPRLNGPEKAMQYNDLKKIAEEAESAGLDMRVLYLKRSAQDLIIANTVHRHFQEHLGESGGTSGGTLEDHFLLYLRILFTSIGVLQSFLEELDPGFIACHDWDLLGDEKQASDIATFVSPNDEVADLVRTVLVDRAAPAKHIHDGGDEVDGLASYSSKLLVKRLQDKLDSFEARYCGAPNREI